MRHAALPALLLLLAVAHAGRWPARGPREIPPPSSTVLATGPAPPVRWGADWVVVVTWHEHDIFWLSYLPPQVRVRSHLAARAVPTT